MFYMFHLFQTYVASVLSGCCICYNDYVAGVYFKCFICFSPMLQLFHCKSRSQQRVVSEEERASAGAMTSFAVSWWQRSTGGRTGIRAGVRGSFLYDMLPLLALPLEQKLVASPRATEMQTVAMEMTRA
jgi:hypothetical protein